VLGKCAFRHILLAAPDVDIGKFGQLAEYYTSLPAKWSTVYTCRKDLAIAASTWVNDAKRLGYEPHRRKLLGRFRITVRMAASH